MGKELHLGFVRSSLGVPAGPNLVPRVKRVPAARLIVLVILLAPAWLHAADATNTPSDQRDPLAAAAQEFKVLTREGGMRPDSPPVAVQRRGSRFPWHGRIYENFRNDALDAIPHEVKQNGERKSLLRRNQFGINLTGPVILPYVLPAGNKLFFSISYEGTRERISRASLHTVPTLAERTGDFSRTVDPSGSVLPIYDPNTTRLNPAYDPALPVSASNLEYLRDLFPDNRIPANRLLPQVQEALALYPAPNANIGPFFRNNYFVNAPESGAADGVIVKVDYSLRARHRFTASANLSNGFLGPSKYFPNEANPSGPDQHFSTHNGGIEYVLTPNRNSINTATFSVNSYASVDGDATATPFPVYGLGAYLPMGFAYANARNSSTSYDVADSISSTFGKHSLQVGVRNTLHQVNTFRPAYPSGFFRFSDGLTSLPGIINTGHAFASFVLGLPEYAERTLVIAPSYFRRSSQSVWLSERYNFGDKLSVSATLNVSRRTPRVEKYNRQSTVDRARVNPLTDRAGALIFAGLDGTPRDFRAPNLDADFSVGLASNPFRNSNTVIRASFGRSHGQIPIYPNQWGTQGFNRRQTLVSPNTQLTPALDMAAGIPRGGPLPNLVPGAADNTIADLMDLSGREPVYQSVSLSIERAMPFSMMLALGGSWSGGRDLLVGNAAANPNAISPDTLRYGNALYDDNFRLALQPFPQYKGFDVNGLYPAGRYERTSGFVRVEKRTSAGLTFNVHYEFSKQMDDYSAPYGIQDFYNRSNDWSVTFYNPPEYLQLSYTYDLPLGANKRFLTFSDWRRSIVDGWSVNGIAYWNNGTPLALRALFNNTGHVLSALNVNVVPGVSPRVDSPDPELWFNPAAFDQPADFTMGNASPTLASVLNPGVRTLDVSINKRIDTGVDRSLDLSCSLFNFLNHANWNYPDTAIGPASAPNVNAGKITGSHGGRVVQLGLKITF